MIFSNPGFFDISNEDFKDQQAQLEELRDVHFHEMVTTGLAERIIGSTAITNISANKSRLTEGTLLYPFRKPQWNLSLMQGESIYADAGIRRQSSLMRDPYLSYFGDQNRENYILYVGRYDPLRGGGHQTSGYAAGMVNDTETAEVVSRDRYIPFGGLEVTDLHVIERQLSEIAAFAIEKSLGIIDPLTLAEGQGPIIGYEDSDYEDGGWQSQF